MTSAAHFAIGCRMNRRSVSSLKENWRNATSPSSAHAGVPRSSRTRTWRASSIGNPRVGNGVRKVSEKVEHQHQDRGHEEDAHQQRIVELGERLEEQLAHAWPAEYRLRDHCPREERRQLVGNVGDDGKERVAKSVLEDDA